MITPEKLIATSYGNIVRNKLLDFFNNAFGDTQALVLGAITYSPDIKQDEMVQHLHHCTEVRVNSFVQAGPDISMVLELRGHGGYPGGETDKSLCTVNFRIKSTALTILLNN